MLDSYSRFINFFNRSKTVEALYGYLLNTVRLQPVELEDLLRGEIVNAVSALDRFIHDLIRDGMLQVFTGLRPKTTGFSNFHLTIDQHEELHSQNTLSPEFTFDKFVTKAIGHLSYQDPEKIKDGLSYVWEEQHKWYKISRFMGVSERDVKIQLKNIVIRRNQIVHEMDLDLLTGDLQPICYNDTSESVDFIKRLGTAIYECVK